jgi:DNA-binding SARP family transcriptional activator
MEVVPMTLNPSGFHLRLLDGFELRLGECTVPVQAGPQRLVIFLALHKRMLPRSHVAGVLWPDVPTDRASANLRASIWRVPSTCRAIIDLSAQHIKLATGVTVDFLEAVALAQRLLDRSENCADDDVGGHARAELSGELLPACYDEWVLTERERFRQLRLHALEALCERLTAIQRYGEAIDAGLAAVCAEPLRESSHRVLIKAHIAEGNNGEAHRQYDVYRRLLNDELGLEPSRGLRDLATQASEARRVLARRSNDEAMRSRPGFEFVNQRAIEGRLLV